MATYKIDRKEGRPQLTIAADAFAVNEGILEVTRAGRIVGAFQPDSWSAILEDQPDEAKDPYGAATHAAV
jgi:hypothetical protein